jgi:hypothetical protein
LADAAVVLIELFRQRFDLSVDYPDSTVQSPAERWRALADRYNVLNTEMEMDEVEV